ncbi:MAG TPA: hypothetical protein DCX22_03900 [Dehalococcoidia bacterium]|nr:hypothetical protein [Dehalococcoidia bacterium]
MILYSWLLIPFGYLMGSIPSSYIIARFRGVDIRNEGDGRISAAAVYRRFKLLPFLITVIMDIGKGLLSVFIARLVTDSMPIWFITALAVVIGHDWSIFLGFKGGLGATVMAGVLCGLIFWPWFIGGLCAGGIIMLITKKSGISSAVILLVTSLLLFIWPFNDSILPGFFPLLLGVLMLFKRFQKEHRTIVNS